MRVLKWTLCALLGHWRRHPLQALGVLAGLWLATALWTGVQALNSQARADYARAGAVVSAPSDSYVSAQPGMAIEQSLYIQMRRAGLKVSPVVEGRLRFARGSTVSLQVVGIDPLTLPAGVQVAGQSFSDFDLAAFMGRPGQAWASSETLRRLGVSPGEQPRTAGGHQLPPLSLQERLAPGVVVVDIGQAQRLMNMSGSISRLLPDSKLAALDALPLPFTAQLRLDSSDTEAELQRLTDSFHLNLTALGLLAFIVGLFIVHASIGLAFEQRRSLLRTLRACGVSRRTLISALALELSVLAIAGGLIGVITGYVVAAALLPDVAASLSSLYGAEVESRLRLSPLWWLGGLLISLLGVMLAGFNTLVRAAGLPVLALAAPEAWRSAQSTWLRRQAVLAVVLVVAGLLSWQLTTSLQGAFAMVAFWLLAAALLLPVLLSLALTGLARVVKKPLTQWFVADCRQQLPALSLALMALLLALASSVGVGSMTEGFRLTFTSWLDQRLAADLYLTPADTKQAMQLHTWLLKQPGVHAVEPQWRVQTTVASGPVQLQGVTPESRLASHWPLLQADAHAWQQLQTPHAVMLSEQLARRLGLQLGEVLELSAAEPSRLKVIGIYADYGNPKGHILVNAAWLRTNFPDAALQGLAVYADDWATANLQHLLHEDFGLDSTRMVEQASLKHWSISIFERTFAATAALNVLTLGVAAMAMFVSMLTLGSSRTVHLAPLWAMGVRRRNLAWLSLGQTILLASLTILCAIPLGLLLAWCLVNVVNVYAFGWRLPLYVFPKQLAFLAALGMLTSLVAMVVPIMGLARRRPAELLQEFSREA